MFFLYGLVFDSIIFLMFAALAFVSVHYYKGLLIIITIILMDTHCTHCTGLINMPYRYGSYINLYTAG